MRSFLLIAGLVGCARSEVLPPVGDQAVGDPDIGESIRMAPGWTAEIYRDYSDEFTYDPADFPDEVEPYEQDNDPTALAILEPPFEPGLAIAAGRRILEIRHSDLAYTVHDFTPPAAEGDGPDYIGHLVFSPLGINSSGGSLLASSSSTNDGDGVFEVLPDWSMIRRTWSNNCRVIIPDPTGRFDATGAPDHFVAQANELVRHSDDARVFGEITTSGILDGDDLLLTHTDWTTYWEVVRLESITRAETALLSGSPAYPERIFLTRVTPSGAAGAMLLLNGISSIGTIDDTGWLPLLESLDPDWSWSNAVLAMPGSPFADGGPTLYVLSSNRSADRDRVLRFRLP
jgi:hypothetical protein